MLACALIVFPDRAVSCRSVERTKSALAVMTCKLPFCAVLTAPADPRWQTHGASGTGSGVRAYGSDSFRHSLQTTSKLTPSPGQLCTTVAATELGKNEAPLFTCEQQQQQGAHGS